MNRKGFTLIEVLIAVVVLFSAVISFSAAFKLYVDSSLKQDLYQEVFITAISLKNMIESKDLATEREGSGEDGELEYSFKAKPVVSSRNYVFMEEEIVGQNTGPFEIILYKVDLTLKRKDWTRAFSFHVTQYVRDAKLFDETL